jgi:hypothetical protein
MIRVLPEEPNRFLDLRAFTPPRQAPEIDDCGDFCGYSTSKCCVIIGNSEQLFSAIVAVGVFLSFAFTRFLLDRLLSFCNPCGDSCGDPSACPCVSDSTVAGFSLTMDSSARRFASMRMWLSFLTKDLLDQAQSIRKELDGMPEHIISRRVRDHLDAARQRMGPMSARGVDTFYDQLATEF